ncbi:hypothetical protein SAMN04487967_2155 [Natronorubrum sediminis]|uniref:Uncharacterized protein n=1 Tax=Natronorubrum sediminis TaxID=640943 RepID=A0A1H6G127_9EURY|nr:hypothetical protein [Natronorubrum sediminis]SEH15605.1 hypothetical protein SAMN04487967_2155 [Natronorubrum sediminis]
MLETLETQITVLLEAVTDDETLEADARSTATRHCRELHAELECVRRALPKTATNDRWNVPPEPPNENQELAADRLSSTHRLTGVTTVTDPMAARYEAARHSRDGRR